MQSIEIIGAVIGLLFLYLEYNANRWLWPVGVIMPIIYIWIFYHSKFYADMTVNIYYLFVSIYGWFYWWRGGTDDKEELPITKTDKRYYLPLIGITLLLFVVIALILIRFTDSPVPYGDSFTTALSIIGMWLLAKKYIEQWWVWLVVNIVSCILYIYKDLKITAMLFAIYALISLFGYFKWKRLMKK